MSEYEPGGRDQEVLVGRLVSLVAELEAIQLFVDYGTVPTSGPGRWIFGLQDILARPKSQEILRRWRTVFAEELDQVRRARNSVVHGTDIGPKNLVNAVKIAERLLSVARTPFINEEPGSASDRRQGR